MITHYRYRSSIYFILKLKYIFKFKFKVLYSIEIAKGCSQLTSIDLEGCDKITDASLNVLKNEANPDVDVLV